MAKINIVRSKSMVGMLGKLTCYANGKNICQLKNGEEYSAFVENGAVEFKCRLNPGTNEKSILLNLSEDDCVTITVKASATGLLVSVSDQSFLVDSRKSIFDKELAVRNKNEIVKFVSTKKIGEFFEVDETNRLIGVRESIFCPLEKHQVFSFDDVIDFEVLEDEKTVIRGGKGGAFLGGVVFGAPGAIVGGMTAKKTATPVCTSLKIKITVNDMSAPVRYVNLLSGSIGKNSMIYKNAYKNAQEIISVMQIACSQSAQTKQNASECANISVADEIQKLKKLADEGVITQEELSVMISHLINKK